MSILERIQRIARANITQFLNQVDQPEDEIAAKIAELEDAAEEAKNALASFAVTYKRMEKSVAAAKESAAAWQAKAEEAVKAGDDSLARRSLSEKMKADKRLSEMEVVLESRRTTYHELKADLVEIHDQLNQARARLQDLISRKRAAAAEEAMGKQMDSLQQDPHRFDSLEDEVTEAETRAEIEREIRGDLKPLEQRMADEAHEREIDEALDALKKKLN